MAEAVDIKDIKMNRKTTENGVIETWNKHQFTYGARPKLPPIQRTSPNSSTPKHNRKRGKICISFVKKSSDVNSNVAEEEFIPQNPNRSIVKYKESPEVSRTGAKTVDSCDIEKQYLKETAAAIEANNYADVGGETRREETEYEDDRKFSTYPPYSRETSTMTIQFADGVEDGSLDSSRSDRPLTAKESRRSMRHPNSSRASFNSAIISQLKSIQDLERDVDSAADELRPYRYQNENQWGIPVNSDPRILETIKRAQTRIHRSAPAMSLDLVNSRTSNFSEIQSEMGRSTPKRVNFTHSAVITNRDKSDKVLDLGRNSPRVMTWYEGPIVNCALPQSNLSKYYTRLHHSSSLTKS